MKIVECVPNFSEGRAGKIIDAIADAIRSVEGARLLDVDSGASANRTVHTFAGPPEAVLEAAFRAIEAGSALIDMRTHKGVHPRMGACDVCPFVPLSGVTMEECVDLANGLGERVGSELRIPVYLYGEAARVPKRRRLPDIRKGEYEALGGKMRVPEWRPDFGPAEFNAKSGATAIGARRLLVAFNVCLDTDDLSVATAIAAQMRESGRGSHRFSSLQAKGWFIPEYECAQVTTNILDFDAAPLHKVFAACRDLAEGLGARVTGSEIVGMVPRRALVDAGRSVAGAEDIEPHSAIDAAVDMLGLSSVRPFDPKAKVLEEALGLERNLL